MLIPINENEPVYDFDGFSEEECKRAANDQLRNAHTGMMSWAEKNFRLKLIDKLFWLRYYKDNQTIYLNSKKGEK